MKKVESTYYATKEFIKEIAANHFKPLFNRFRGHYDDDLQEHTKTLLIKNELFLKASRSPLGFSSMELS